MHRYIAETKFGFFEIAESDGRISKIALCDGRDYKINETPSILIDKTISQLNEYFSGEREAFDLPVKMEGTPFCMSVWEILQKIPYGGIRTYKDVAVLLGNKKACRAVGLACNKNPLLIVVPCHRVVCSDGKSGGFAAGVKLKELLLNLENNVIRCKK